MQSKFVNFAIFWLLYIQIIQKSITAGNRAINGCVLFFTPFCSQNTWELYLQLLALICFLFSGHALLPQLQPHPPTFCCRFYYSFFPLWYPALKWLNERLQATFGIGQLPPPFR